MYVAQIGKQDVILGTPWLRKHNPEIDWEKEEVLLSRCPLGARGLSFYGMDSTYASTIAILERVFNLEEKRLGGGA